METIDYIEPGAGTDHVARLRELADMITARLPGYVIYDAHGDAAGEALFCELPDEGNPLWPGGAGQICRMAAGQRFETHSHYGCAETIVVICGVMHITVSGQTMRLAPGECLRLEPGQDHAAEAVTDCVVVGITVPRDGGYPDVSSTAAKSRPA